MDAFHLEKLKALEGIHPRLMLDRNWIEQRRPLLHGELADRWNRFKEQADYLAIAEPPAYYLDADIHELWQRNVGDNVASLAFAYAISGEKKYIEGAEKWALASCSYPTWGRYEPDLPMGHQLFGLAVFYDWCYTAMNPQAKDVVKQTLIKYSRQMFEGAKGGSFWVDWNLQNHMWIGICGLGTAGLALYDQVPEAMEWIELSIKKYEDVMSSLGDDGASHEGVMYWGYGISWMMRFMDVARTSLGINLYETAWFKNTASYRLYMGLPIDCCTASENILDFADSSRSDIDGIVYIMGKLAAEYKLGFAQWLSKEALEKKIGNTRNFWLSILWYDPQVEAVQPGSLPAMRHFDDMGFVSARSDWSGKESIVAFKCGPFLGHKAVDLNSTEPFCDWGGGHVHQDTNHFTLYGAGEFLLRDDGYVYKTTETHNTLLVNGKGQTGGDQMWFHGDDLLKRNAKPLIDKVVSTCDYDYMVGDGTPAYDPGLGLLQYHRHLVFVKPNILLVIDDIEAKPDCELELRFFPESQVMLRAEEGQLLVGKRSLLLINPLENENAEDRFESIEVPVNINGDLQQKLVFRRTCRKGGKWQSVVAISWNEAPCCPVYVQAKISGSKFEFNTGGKKVEVDIDSREVTVEDVKTEAACINSNADLAGIIINDKILDGFSPDRQEYSYDTSHGVKVVRNPDNQLKIWGIPHNIAAKMEEVRPEGSFGQYRWIVAAADGSQSKVYTLTVEGSELAVDRVEIQKVTAGGNPAASVPEVVLDDDPNTYWATEGDGQFLLFDLGTEKPIKGVDIGWLKGDIRRACFDINISLDGIEFDSVLPDMKSSGTTTLPEYYAVGEVAARYVKIVCHGNTLNGWNSITQVAIYQ
ncbi:MAG: hypothetical protein K0R57_5854 [Paenibacillaceae bacterium]|jgi:hypothetical protein|nr:hypothetical protein [Paenibacillaceae bacterium]